MARRLRRLLVLTPQPAQPAYRSWVADLTGCRPWKLPFGALPAPPSGQVCEPIPSLPVAPVVASGGEGGAGGQARPGRPASRPGQPASQTATRGLGQLSLTAQLDNPARQPSLDSQRAKPAGQASRPKIRRSVPHLGHWRPPNCPALIWIRGEGAVAPKWLSRKNCFEDARKGRSSIAKHRILGGGN